MKMKHTYVVEISTTEKECEMLHAVGEMLFKIQYNIDYDHNIYFESVDTGEVFDNSDLARARGVLESLMGHKA